MIRVDRFRYSQLAIWIALAAASTSVPACFGQAVAGGSISGQVSDSSGASVQGADVTATQTETKFSRAAKTDLGVHVGAVHIHKPAVVVNDPAGFLNAFLEHAVRRGVSDHERGEVCGVGGGLGAQVAEVDVALVVAGHGNDAQARQRGAGRVGAVGRGGNQAHIAMALSASGVIAANHQQAGVLALRSRVGLQRYASKAGDRRQHMLQLADIFAAGFHSQPFWQKKISGIASSHIQHVANLSDRFHSLRQNHFHRDTPYGLSRQEGALKVRISVAPFETPRLMAELVSGTDTARREKEMHPLLMIGAFVVHFLAIHPFQDGNGRLSRVLTTLLLLQSGYRHVPYSSLERIVEENKDGYYLALRASQKLIRSEGENLDDWLRFFLTSLKKQKDVLLGKIEREQLLEKLTPLEEKMLAIARERGRITIADAVTLLAANRNTVKLHLRQLVQQGYLEQHGTGKGTWYSVGR